MDESGEIDGPGGLQPGILAGLAERLSPYDPADLLASVAALQLLPENADRTVRLEAFAHAIASLPDEPDKPHISLSRLKQFANGEPLGVSVAAQEDPCDNAFTEAFPFHGGTYIVFPGIVDESTFVLRHLAEALFLHPEPFPNPDYIGEAYVLLLAALVLSDEIAHRAGLGRGIMPRYRGREASAEVPGTQRLNPLKRAVSFQWAELEQVLAGRKLPPSAQLEGPWYGEMRLSVTPRYQDREVKLAAINALRLVGIRNEQVETALLEFLRDPDFELMLATINALGNPKNKSPILIHQLKVLSRLLYDRNVFLVEYGVILTLYRLLDGRPLPSHRWVTSRK